MAGTKDSTRTTVDILVDMNFKAGELTGEAQLLAFVERSLRHLASTGQNIDIKPKLNLSAKGLRNQLREFNTDIDRALTDPKFVSKNYGDILSRKTGESSKTGAGRAVYQSRLKTLQKDYRALSQFAETTVLGKLDEFSTKRFQKTYDAFRKGATVSEKDLSSIRKYQALLQTLTAQVKKLNIELAKSKGVSLNEYVTGTGKESKTVESVGATRSTRSPSLVGIGGSLARENTDIDAEFRRRAKQRYDDERRSSIALQKRIDRRKLLRADSTALQGYGFDPRQGGRGAALSSMAALRNQGTLLKVVLDGVNSRLTRVKTTSADTKFRKGFLDRWGKRATELSGELDVVNAKISKLRKANLDTVLGGRRTFQRTDKFKRERALARVGQESIASRGGSIADLTRASDAELPALMAALKRRITVERSLRDRMIRRGRKDTPDFARLNKDIVNANQALQALKLQAKGFGTVSQQMGSLFRQFFRYAIGYGVLYQSLAAIRALIGGVVDLNKSLKSIQAVTGATLDDMSQIEVGIKRVALSTKFSVNEIAEAGRVLAQAGVKPEDFTSVLESVATFAAATEASIQVAADLVSTMRNVFTDLNDQTIANQLTKAVNISKLTAEDLKTILSRGAQVAKGFNLTSDQFLSAVTVLRNAGIKASTVATGLRQGLIELLSPDQRTIKTLKIRYEQLGEAIGGEVIKARFFAFTQANDPLLAVLREYQRLGFTGEAKQQFGRVFDIRAQNAISALINNIDLLQGAQTKLTFGNSALRASQTQMEALANSTANLGAAITVLADDMGGGLVKSLDAIVDSATSAVTALSKLDNQVKAVGGAGLPGAALAGLGAGAIGLASSSGGFVSRGARFVAGGAIGTAGSLAAQGVASKAGASETATDLSGIGGAIAGVLALDMLKGLKNLFGSLKKASSHLLSINKVAKGFVGPLKPTGNLDKGLFNLKTIIAGTSFARGAALLAGLSAGAIAGWVAGVIAFVTGLAFFMGRTTFSSAQDDLSQSIKNFDTAMADRVSQLKELDEFRLTTPGFAATPGTTAASVEGLRKSITDINYQLSTSLGVSSESMGDVKNALEDLAKQGPQAGSDLRKVLIETLDAAAGLSISTKLSDKQLGELASAVDDSRSTTRALQESVRETITAILETEGDLTLSQISIRDAFREMSAQGSKSYDKLIGLATATPEEMEGLLTQLLKGAERLSKASDAAGKSMKEINEAADQEISNFARAVLLANTPQQVRDLILRTRNSMERLGLTVTSYIGDLNEALTSGILSKKEIGNKVTGLPEGFIEESKASVGLFKPEVKPTEDKAELARRETVALQAKRGELQIKINKLSPGTDVNSSAYATGIGSAKEFAAEIRKIDNRLQVLNEFMRIKKNSDERMADLNAKTLDKVAIQAESARKVFDSPAFQKRLESPEVSPYTKTLVEYLKNKEGGELLTEKRIPGVGKTDELIPSRLTADALKLATDFTGTQVKALEQQSLPDTTLNDKQVQSLDARIKEAVRNQPGKELDLIEAAADAEQEASDAIRTYYREKLKNPLVKGTPEQDKAEKSLKTATLKANKQKLAREEQLRDAQLRLVAIQREIDSRLNLAKQDKIRLLESEVARAKLEDPEKLTTTTADNPLIQLRDLRIAKLKEEKSREAKIAGDDRVAADKRRASVTKGLEIQDKINALLYSTNKEIRTAANTFAKKQATLRARILRDQMTSLNRELDFALEQGNQAQINQIQEDRLNTFEALRKAEREQLELAKADVSDLALFDEATSRLSAELARASTLAIQELRAAQQRFSQLSPVASEGGDFEKAGARANQGNALSQNSRLEKTKQDLLLAKSLLAREKRNLEALQRNNEGKLGVTEAQRGQFKNAEPLTFDNPTQPKTQRAIDDALLAEQTLQKAVHEMEVSLGGLTDETERLGSSFEHAMTTGFDLSILAANVDASRSSIENLGKAIQDSLVGGMEDFGDAVADSIVDGKNFADTLKDAWTDMIQSIAKQMIKAGILKMITALIGGTGGEGGSGQSAGFWANVAGLFSSNRTTAATGGEIEKKAGGGTIRGPGTGTSDSVKGVVVDQYGRPVRGIAVSEGEGIITAEVMKKLGSGNLDKLNDNPNMISNIVAAMNEKPMRKAAGGVVSDSSTLNKTTNINNSNTSNVQHKISANVEVGAGGGDIDEDTLQKLDDGMTTRVREYVEDQLRPGGLLQAAR